LVGLEVAELGNDVTIVVNFYDVGSPNQACRKSYIS
jgi:hypothetical protein